MSRQMEEESPQPRDQQQDDAAGEQDEFEIEGVSPSQPVSQTQQQQQQTQFHAMHLPFTLIPRLRDIFQVLDERKSGHINARDLAVALSLADLDEGVTTQERTGLLAVHCQDRESGLTEHEFLSICDVVYASKSHHQPFPSSSSSSSKTTSAAAAGGGRKQEGDNFDTHGLLRKMFDAMANNEHGVLPIEGILGWGEEVLKSCDECLLVEHGFDYDESVLTMKNHPLLMSSKKKKKKANDDAKKKNNKKKKQMMSSSSGSKNDEIPFAEDGSDFDDEYEEDEDDVEEDDEYESDAKRKQQETGGAKRSLKFDQLGLDDDEKGRLGRRRSSSGLLVPRQEELEEADSHHTPSKHLRLPEMAAQQRLSKLGDKKFIGTRSTRNNNASSSSSAGSLGDHDGGGTTFSHEDVEDTTAWLMSTLAERYSSASESEKREIEMLMELARAAGHSVEDVHEIVTREQFVSFMEENSELAALKKR